MSSLHTPLTLAFAGPGQVNEESVKDLLNDLCGFGPEDADGYPTGGREEIRLIFPLTEALFPEGSGVEEVYNWSGYAGLAFEAVTTKEDAKEFADTLKEAEDVVTVPNPAAKIVQLLQEAEGEKYLIVLWGDGEDDGDEPTGDLIDLADAADIPIKDLCQALLDIDVKHPDEVEEAPEAAPEPEPEPEPTPRRGRRRKAAEEPLEAQEEALTESDVVREAKEEGAKFAAKVKEAKAEAAENLRERKARTGYNSLEEEVAAERQAQVKQAQVLLEEVTDVATRLADAVDLAEGTLQAVYAMLTLEDQAAAARNLNEPYERPITVAVREALEALAAADDFHEEDEAVEKIKAAFEAGEKGKTEAPAEPVKRGRGRPRKIDPDADKVAYYKFEDGTYRKVTRGKKPGDAVKVLLTEDEIEALEDEGLIA